MSRADDAWKWAHDGWTGSHITEQSAELDRMRYSLARLKLMRLPVAAIKEIQHLLKCHHEYLEATKGV